MNSAERCRRYRRRILEMSQHVPAAHVASAFSCLEVVDCIYNEVMNRYRDTFIMSKGHGCLAQYVILQDLGILTEQDLNNYCKPGGKLGAHPDLGVSGIEASTGSLGHGLAMAVGMALAERNCVVYVLLSDGELQEGSTWEAIMLASSFRLDNLVVVVDNNDFQALARTSMSHPSFYPVVDKFKAFGWKSCLASGHNVEELKKALLDYHTDSLPLAVVAKTTKGKGVSFMENEPIWHYRSPTPDEYQRALKELG